jgi:glycosyltransferase involved in cell wall biosynthesis
MNNRLPQGAVSVVIPVYNRADMVLEAIESALSQGPLVGEVLVVDDGSTDNTRQSVLSIRDPRVRLLTQANAGWAVARNHGWREAKTPWIIFLDSDDALETNAIAALLEAGLADPNRIPFGMTSIHGGSLDAAPSLVATISRGGGNLLRAICFFPGGTILASLLPRKALEEVGGFNTSPDVYVCADIDFAVRLALRREFTFVPTVCYKTRMHEANTYRDPNYQQRIYLAAVGVMKRNIPNDSRHWLLKRRSIAYFRGLAAQCDLEQRRAAAAARGYLRALLWWPIKVGAWRGLAASLAGLLR